MPWRGRVDGFPVHAFNVTSRTTEQAWFERVDGLTVHPTAGFVSDAFNQLSRIDAQSVRHLTVNPERSR